MHIIILDLRLKSSQELFFLVNFISKLAKYILKCIIKDLQRFKAKKVEMGSSLKQSVKALLKQT